jgi:pSer/pThr/pTyr-binding forkhead associated (FHA) protein
MQVKLHLVKGNPQGKQVEVPPGTLTIGRAEDSGLIIASTRVSRHHCEIANEQVRVVVRDKGSGNGTFVNGSKVKEHILQPGDEVRVGPLAFAVEIDGKRQRPGQPAKPGARTGPAAKPAAAQAPKRAFGKGKASPADILASLENMAGKKPAGGKPGKADDVLEISDEDLLDTNK